MEDVAFLDIETTSLDAFTGMIVGFGLVNEKGKEHFVLSKGEKDEARVIGRLLGKLEGCQVIITWNGKKFDFPFILTRALKSNVDASKLGMYRHLDLIEFARFNMAIDHASLERVCRFFGINKNHDISGSDIPRLYLKYLQGDIQAGLLIKEHCLDDLRALRAFYQRVKPYLR
jgi:uncharacterized protein YprB with RNaseH-like and TPR domain